MPGHDDVRGQESRCQQQAQALAVALRGHRRGNQRRNEPPREDCLRREGLIATSLAYGDGSVRPELIRELIAEYAEVFPSLRKHGRPGYEYPSPESLLNVVKAGAPVVRTFVGTGRGFKVPYPVGARDTRMCEPAEKWLGVGKDSAASEHIIRVVERDDPRPVWVIVWGGAMDLAQALWKVRHDYAPEAAARFIAKS